MKDAFKRQRLAHTESDQLNYCHDESIYNGSNLAILLGKSSEYQIIVDKLKAKLNILSKELETSNFSILERYNLVTTNNLPDFDKLNNIAINGSGFFDKKIGKELGITEVFDLNIKLREKQAFGASEAYSAWSQFYEQSNNLFIRTYQKRLS